MAKQEVEEKKNTQVAAFQGDFESMAGAGGENVTQDDMSVPFIKLAQALSPEVDESDPKHIEGLKQGDFFNSATQEVYSGSKGFTFVPCLYRRSYIEWTPRDSGGGFVADHADLPAIAKEDGKGNHEMPNGNLVIMTATWYGLIIPDDENADVEQAVITLASTQFKKSRMLVSRLKKLLVAGANGKFNPPFFYNTLRVTSVSEQNDNGKWKGWNFDLTGSIKDLSNAEEVFKYAKLTYEAVKEGTLKANMANAGAGTSEDVDSQGARTSGQTSPGMRDMDEEIPF